MTEPEPQPLATPPSSIKRIAFFGTPPEAARILEALIAADFDVALVVTQPDRRRGRGSKTTPSPVKAVAMAHQIPVDHDLDRVADSGVDLGVVVAFGRLIPRGLLERVPMVNLHYSLLPRWRGAAPVERAILAGDPTTGVCVMEVAEGLDTGAVYARVETRIGRDETAAELRDRLTTLGAELVVEHLRSGLGEPEPQVGVPTYAAKLDRAESRLQLDQSPVEIHRRVRIGRAWSTFRDSRLGIEQVHPNPNIDDINPGVSEAPVGSIEGGRVRVGGGWVELIEVKPEGKRAMKATDWLNGVRPEPGERLV